MIQILIISFKKLPLSDKVLGSLPTALVENEFVGGGPSDILEFKFSLKKNEE